MENDIFASVWWHDQWLEDNCPMNTREYLNDDYETLIDNLW